MSIGGSNGFKFHRIEIVKLADEADSVRGDFRSIQDALVDPYKTTPVEIRPFPIRAIQLDVPLPVDQPMGVIVTSFANRMIHRRMGCLFQ